MARLMPDLNLNLVPSWWAMDGGSFCSVSAPDPFMTVSASHLLVYHHIFGVCSASVGPGLHPPLSATEADTHSPPGPKDEERTSARA